MTGGVVVLVWTGRCGRGRGRCGRMACRCAQGSARARAGGPGTLGRAECQGQGPLPCRASWWLQGGGPGSGGHGRIVRAGGGNRWCRVGLRCWADGPGCLLQGGERAQGCQAGLGLRWCRSRGRAGFEPRSGRAVCQNSQGGRTTVTWGRWGRGHAGCRGHQGVRLGAWREVNAGGGGPGSHRASCPPRSRGSAFASSPSSWGRTCRGAGAGFRARGVGALCTNR